MGEVEKASERRQILTLTYIVVVLGVLHGNAKTSPYM